MTTPYTHILDVAREAQPPENGILSRTIYNDDRIGAGNKGQPVSDYDDGAALCDCPKMLLDDRFAFACLGKRPGRP